MLCKYPESICANMTVLHGIAYCNSTPCSLRDKIIAPIIDFVPVVRCRDCEFYETAYYDQETKQVCRLLSRRFQPDDFCSYGKHKVESFE